MKANHKIQIHENIGECVTVEKFAEQVSKATKQEASGVVLALSFMVPELGLVGAMEEYCNICGFIAI